MPLETSYQVAIVTQAFPKMPFSQASRIGAAYGAQRHSQKYYDRISALLHGGPSSLGLCTGHALEAARISQDLAKSHARVMQAALPGTRR